MPKATLEFNLPEEESEFRTACNAQSMAAAIHEIGNQVFRPARKHGYSDEKLRAMVEGNSNAGELIGLLEERFYEILKEYGVEDHG